MSDNRHKELEREPKKFHYLLAGLLCLAIFLTGLNGNLSYYIHPRYELFTMTLSLIGAIASLFGFLFYRFEGESTVEYDGLFELLATFTFWLLGKSAWLILIVVFALVVIQPKPLLSEAADRKRNQNYWESYAQLENIFWVDNPSQINEVVGLVGDEKTISNIIGQELKLSGFIQRSDNEDFFKLSRFVLNCCAVDATPVELLVYWPGWQEELSESEWVEVEGSIQVDRTLGTSEAIFRAQTVVPIDEPKEPYEYLRLD